MLSGEQQKRLHAALIEAFPDIEILRQMVKFGLNENLYVIANPKNLSTAAFDLIQWSESRNKTLTLLVIARNSNPDNAALRLIAEELLLAPDSHDLESIVISSVGFSNIVAFREKLSRCELAVCRVELSPFFGTGFLVGPDLLITNYHVMASVILGRANPESVIFRFDYKESGNGVIQPGQEFKLAPNWLVACSPNHELDFALLRVNDVPGEKPIAGQQGAPTRGWLKPEPHVFTQDETLIVIQHPQAEPLKISFGAFLNERQNPERVIHSVSTLGGSSGSPCFTTDLKLVALHNAGNPVGNTAVPFSPILDELKVKNIWI